MKLFPPNVKFGRTNPLLFQWSDNRNFRRYHTSCASRASYIADFILNCRRLRTIQLHSKQGLTALDEGCPFDISSNGQLFNQHKAGRSSKQPFGRMTMLPIIYTGTERGKGFRWASSWRSHSRVATTSRHPGKGGRKGSVSCGPSRDSSA